jgi:dihydroflavonol-4-reductase
MFGPYDARPSSGRMILDVARGRVPGWTPGLNNFVDVRDVARGMIAAWQKGARGERYILGGENLTYKDIFERIARAAGTDPPRRAAPRWAATLLGWVGDVVERVRDREPFINSVAVSYGYLTSFQFTSEKAKRVLGYETGPIETAIRDAIAWFREHGMLR